MFGLNFFKTVWFLFAFVSDYDNEHETMEKKIQTGLKKIKSKINNLNNNICIVK